MWGGDAAGLETTDVAEDSFFPANHGEPTSEMTPRLPPHWKYSEHLTSNRFPSHLPEKIFVYNFRVKFAFADSAMFCADSSAHNLESNF